MNQINPSWPTPHDIGQTDIWGEPLVAGLRDVVAQGNTSDARIGALEAVDGSGVISVNGKFGPEVTLTKTDVGLPAVDNTSDVNKPISDATRAALATKLTTPVGGAIGQAVVKTGTNSFGYATIGSGTGGGAIVTEYNDGSGYPVLSSTQGGSAQGTTTYLRGVAYGSSGFGRQPSQLTDPASLFGSIWDYGSQATYTYLASRGHKIIRMSLLWEHLQRNLGAPLDPTLLGFLQQAVGWIGNAGMRVVFDLHNYAGYRTAASGYIEQKLGQGVVTDAHFADFWVRMSTVFKNNPTVYAYGLMNEPYNAYSTSLTPAQRFVLWQQSSQYVVNAIRANGDTNRIMVGKLEVDGGSKVWSTQYPTPWITDPANNFAYEQHHYSDNNHSGTYQNSYATDLASAQSQGYPTIQAKDLAYLKPYLDWVRAFNVDGYIGEYAVPTIGADAAQWAAVADAMLTVFDQYNLDFTWWAVGENWGAYTLAPYTTPTGGNGVLSVTNNPGAATLEAHPTLQPPPGGWAVTLITPTQVDGKIQNALSGSGTAQQTNSQSGTAYTLALTDAGDIIENSGTSVLTVTVPNNTTVPFPVGTVIELFNLSSGSITLSPASGVTLRSPSGLRMVAQNASAALRKRGTNDWVVSGLTSV